MVSHKMDFQSGLICFLTSRTSSKILVRALLQITVLCTAAMFHLLGVHRCFRGEAAGVGTRAVTQLQFYIGNLQVYFSVFKYE